MRPHLGFFLALLLGFGTMRSLEKCLPRQNLTLKGLQEEVEILMDKKL
ncbi:MAG: hypothetical protein HC913_19150, partial [Microscillaceae bacterium]|nr:hypothetical protein [Microscillaceae bacterium]